MLKMVTPKGNPRNAKSAAVHPVPGSSQRFKDAPGTAVARAGLGSREVDLDWPLPRGRP